MPDMGTGLIALDPEADVWLAPGHGVLTSGPAGLAAHTGVIAEAAAKHLALGPTTPEDLFRVLFDHAPPHDILSRLHDLRAAGLVRQGRDGPFAPPITRADLQGLVADLAKNTDLYVPGDSAPATRALHIEVTAQDILIGPIFEPDQTMPCLSCFRMCRTEHDDLGRLLKAFPFQHIHRRKIPALARPEQLARIREAIGAILHDPKGAIRVLRHGQNTSLLSHARAHPFCPECHAYSHKTSDVDPVTGIIRDLADQPAAPDVRRLQHVVLARHAFPLAHPTLPETIRNRQGRSAGKGRSRKQACLVARAEAMERYAGLARADAVHLVSSVADISAPHVCPTQWLGFHPHQYATAGGWRALNRRGAWVPDQPDPHHPIGWTRVTRLASGIEGYAPAALCWHQFPQDRPGRADSNGCAAGQTPEDAQLRALMEVIERDVVGRWWWGQRPSARLALDALNDPWIVSVQGMIKDRGFALSVRDLTDDTGLPVCAAIAWPHANTGPVLLGFGAALTMPEAAGQAVAEVLQGLPLETADEIGGHPADGLLCRPGRQPDRDALAFLSHTHPNAHRPLTFAAEDPSPLRTLVARLESMGLPVWWLDQSRPDVPLAVARVIVPGLCHTIPRLGHDRLFNQSIDLENETHQSVVNPFLIPE